MDKGGVTPRIVRFPKEAEPDEACQGSLSLGRSSNHRVHVGGVIKRVSLGKHRCVGEGIVAFDQMVKPRMGFPADVGEGLGPRPEGGRGRGLVINGGRDTAG